MPEHTPSPTPHRAIYGFSFYLLFFTLFIVYLLWALLPTEPLSGYLQLSYLPNKYFALCIPMLVLCGLFFFIIIYPAINLSMTPNVDALESVVDTKLVLRGKSFNKDSGCLWDHLKSSARPAEECADSDDHLHGQNCEMCHEPHRRSKVQAIATLRFMDLSEMNRDYFG